VGDVAQENEEAQKNKEEKGLISKDRSPNQVCFEEAV